MRGRKMLPTEVKVLQGTAQKCRLNQNEPVITKKIATNPAPPESLSEEAKKNWEFVLDNEGVSWIGQCDQATLENYCTLWADIRACDERIKADGRFVYENGALKEHPAMKLKARLIPVFRSVASELGLTPSSRSRVSALNENKDPDSKSYVLEFDEESIAENLRRMNETVN